MGHLSICFICAEVIVILRLLDNPLLQAVALQQAHITFCVDHEADAGRFQMSCVGDQQALAGVSLVLVQVMLDYVNIFTIDRNKFTKPSQPAQTSPGNPASLAQSTHKPTHRPTMPTSLQVRGSVSWNFGKNHYPPPPVLLYCAQLQ